MNDVQEVPPSLLLAAIPERIPERILQTIPQSKESPRREAEAHSSVTQAPDEVVLDKYDIGTLACTD